MNQRTILRSVLAALLSLVATTATAHDFEVGGIYYNYNDDGTVYVTYQGSYSGEYDDEYTGDVVIPSSVTYSGTTYSVTSIGSDAFLGCSGLTSITIPNSVTSIGNSAFEGCSGLTSITIPNSVTSIGHRTFYGCRGLTSVTIPNSVTSIGDWAFSGCSGLTSITIPNSVTSIGYGAFFWCSGLTSIIVDSENKIYDSRENCNAIIETATNNLHTGCKNTIIPNSVTSIIGRSAFGGCSGLTSITIPNSVTSIGDGAFSYCSGLTSVTIPNSVTSIGNFAFEDCRGLTSITIPNSVTSIGNSAFEDCRGLTSITIPNSVTSIGNWTFYGCSGLTSVTIGNSVTTIGDRAFYKCSGLTSVISKAVTPPTCRIDVFSTETYSVPLIVPSVAKEAYQAAPVWSNFSNYAEPERKITAMEFSASTFGIENGKTLQLSPKVTPEDATFADVFLWTSSNEDVATVDSNGVVTAIADGTATITAQTVDGSNLTAACVVTVGTGAVEDIETNAARIYSANGNIIIAAAEDGEASVYDFTGRLIKSVPVVAGDNTAVPVMPGCYIVRTSVKAQSVIVK